MSRSIDITLGYDAGTPKQARGGRRRTAAAAAAVPEGSRETRDVLEFVRILLEGTPRAFLEESNAPRPLIRDDGRNIRVSFARNGQIIKPAPAHSVTESFIFVDRIINCKLICESLE